MTTCGFTTQPVPVINFYQVVFTEDMAADPMGVLEGVLDFLGLDLLDPQGEKVLLIVGLRVIAVRLPVAYLQLQWLENRFLGVQVRSTSTFGSRGRSSRRSVLGLPNVFAVRFVYTELILKESEATAVACAGFCVPSFFLRVGAINKYPKSKDTHPGIESSKTPYFECICTCAINR